MLPNTPRDFLGGLFYQEPKFFVRKLLSFRDDAVRDLIRVRLALAALLAFGPSAKLGVALRGPGFLSGRLRTAFAPHLGGKVGATGNPLVTAIRAFHPEHLTA